MEITKRRRSNSSERYSPCSVDGNVTVESRPAQEVLLRLNHFRNNGYFDITLKVGSKKFPAHKNVLAAFSLYFQRMFLENSSVILTQIKLEEFSEDIFEDLLNYIYSKRIVINEDNVFKLLESANILQSRSLKNECIRAFEAFINVQNCMDAYYRASVDSLKPLANKCLHFIKLHFYELSAARELQKLSSREFLSLLGEVRRVPVNVAHHRERDILDAVIQWYNRKKQLEPEGVLPELLSKIDLSSIKPTYLRRVANSEELISQSPECMRLINKALTFAPPSRLNQNKEQACTEGIAAFSERGMMLISAEGELIKLLEQPPFDPRVLSSLLSDGNKLYAATGEACVIWCYNTVTDDWTELPQFAKPRYNFALAKLYGRLYAIGGQSSSVPEPNKSPLKSVIVLNEREGRWVYHSTLARGVQDAQVVVVNDKMYIVGKYSVESKTEELLVSDDLETCVGTNAANHALHGIPNLTSFAGGFNKRVRSFVQELDPYSRTWTVITHLPTDHWLESAEQLVRVELGDESFHTRSSSSNVSVSPKQDGYCQGFKNGKDEEELQPEYKSYPESFGVCAHDKGIYVIGGESADGLVSSSVFFFDPSINRWWRRGEISTHTRDPIVAVIDGSLTVFATQNCGNPTVERFSSSNISWEVCGKLPDDVLWGDGPILIPT